MQRFDSKFGLFSPPEKIARSLIAFLLLLLALSSQSAAEQLWVRNQPFQGEVRGTGSNMLVEAQLFLKLLQIDAKDQGDVMIIGGFPIPVEQSGTIRMIPLRDVVDAAGLSIMKNEALGTVDVRLAKSGLDHHAVWRTNEVASTPSSEKGEKTKLEGETFRLSVPSHLTVLSDPAYLKSGQTDNAKTAPVSEISNQKLGGQTAFFVTTKDGPKQGLLTVNMIPNLNQSLSLKEERVLLGVVSEGVQDRGGSLIGKPITRSIAGKRYHKLVYKDVDHLGRKNKNEIFIHFSDKHDRAYLMLLSVPESEFSRVAPQLRLVVKNFRYK